MKVVMNGKKGKEDKGGEVLKLSWLRDGLAEGVKLIGKVVHSFESKGLSISTG